MHVTVHIENSEGVGVKVFDESVRTMEQVDLVRSILDKMLSLEKDLKGYVASLGEDP